MISHRLAEGLGFVGPDMFGRILNIRERGI